MVGDGEMGDGEDKGKGTINDTSIGDDKMGDDAGQDKGTGKGECTGKGTGKGEGTGKGTGKGEGTETGYEWISEILSSECSMALGGMLDSLRRALKGKGHHDICETRRGPGLSRRWCPIATARAPPPA